MFANSLAVFLLVLDRWFLTWLFTRSLDVRNFFCYYWRLTLCVIWKFFVFLLWKRDTNLGLLIIIKHKCSNPLRLKTDQGLAGVFRWVFDYKLAIILSFPSVALLVSIILWLQLVSAKVHLLYLHWRSRDSGVRLLPKIWRKLFEVNFCDFASVVESISQILDPYQDFSLWERVCLVHACFKWFELRIRLRTSWLNCPTFKVSCEEIMNWLIYLNLLLSLSADPSLPIKYLHVVFGCHRNSISVLVHFV